MFYLYLDDKNVVSKKRKRFSRRACRGTIYFFHLNQFLQFLIIVLFTSEGFHCVALQCEYL